MIFTEVLLTVELEATSMFYLLKTFSLFLNFLLKYTLLIKINNF